MEQGNVQRIITEAIEGIETIKSANAEKSFLLNWKNMFTSQLLITKNKNRYIAILEYYRNHTKCNASSIFNNRYKINNQQFFVIRITNWFCFYSNNGYEANSKFGFLL